MTAKLALLPVSFYSIVVLRQAVASRFPGGPEDFERIFEPTRQNRELALLVRMSVDDVEHTLSRLQSFNITPGTDAAVVDMERGPILDCPGIDYVKTGPTWSVSAQDAVEDRGASSLPQALLRLLEDPTVSPPAPGWTTVASRPFFGRSEWVEEYLMARKVDGGIALDIFWHWPLGNVPLDWYDDDGEPVPTRRTDDGGLRLPEISQGRRVVAAQDGFFVGDLQPVQEQKEVVIEAATEGAVRDALAGLYWDHDAIPDLVSKLRALG